MKMKQCKKWLLAAMMLLAGVSGAEAQVTEGTEYLLHLSGGNYYLSAETSKAGSDSELTMQEVGRAGYEQTVTFTAAAGGYNVAVGQSFTVVRDSWYMRYKKTADVELGSKNAIFAVEESGQGIVLKNLGTGKYVGCDSRTSGSKLYSDKNGDKVCVFILETLDIEFYKDRLSSLIAEANGLLASTEEGDGSGQYPAGARAALTSAVSDAESALSGEEDAVKGAIQTLSDAVKAYTASKNPTEFAPGFYRFAYKGISGTYLSSGWQANSWEPDNVMSTGIILNEGESGYNQQFMLSRTSAGAAANGYNIRDMSGYYLFNSKGNLLYDEANDIDPDSSDAIFTLEEEGSYVRIVNAATGKYVGPVDNTIGWTWIHLGTNYSGPADGCLFAVEYLGGDVAAMLQEVIDEALALLESTEEGTEPGQYPAAARKDLAEVIDGAREILAGGDEEKMIEEMDFLRREMSYYQDCVVAPYFREGVYTFYHEAVPGAVLASGWHANSWESANVEHTALILNESEAGEYNIEFTVRKGPDSSEFSGYNILDEENNPLVNDDGKLLVDEETELDSNQALYVFESEGSTLRIRSLGTGKYVGPVDNTKGWSWIHAGTKHTGTDGGDVFRAVFIRESGVSPISAAADFRVMVDRRTLSITGADSAAVYDVAGVQVARISGDGTVTLLPGVYVVAADTAGAVRSIKVMVK